MRLAGGAGGKTAGFKQDDRAVRRAMAHQEDAGE